MSIVPELLSSRDVVLTRLPELEVLGDRFANGGDPVETSIILALDASRAYYVGRELDRFDRELRRTTARARKGDLPLAESLAESAALRVREDVRVTAYDDKLGSTSYDERPRELSGSLHGTYPDAPIRSSLRLVAAEPGSALLLLDAVGDVVDLLISDPVTAIANAAAWSGAVRWVRVWFSRKDDPLDGVSGRQVLTILSEFGASPAEIFGPPDGEVDLGTTPEIQLPDGTIMRGPRRINLVHKHADGSTSWVEIE